MGPLERFEIGTYPHNAPSKAKTQTQKLSELWQKGGATAPVFEDVQTVRWLKVAINASACTPAWQSYYPLSKYADRELQAGIQHAP
jgi:ketopantoate reductase